MHAACFISLYNSVVNASVSVIRDETEIMFFWTKVRLSNDFNRITIAINTVYLASHRWVHAHSDAKKQVPNNGDAYSY